MDLIPTTKNAIEESKCNNIIQMRSFRTPMMLIPTATVPNTANPPMITTNGRVTGKIISTKPMKYKGAQINENNVAPKTPQESSSTHIALAG